MGENFTYALTFAVFEQNFVRHDGNDNVARKHYVREIKAILGGLIK